MRYHRHAPGGEQRHALRLVERAGGRGELRAPRLAFSRRCHRQQRWRIGRARLEVAIGESAAHGGERVQRPVEHGHARQRKLERERVVTNLRVVGCDGDGLVRTPRGRERGVREAAMQVVAVAEIGAEQSERGVGIGQQIAEAAGEMRDEICARAPGVERIGGFEPGIQPGGDRRFRAFGDRGEGDARAIGKIDEQLAFPAGIADRHEPARPGAPFRRKQQQGRGELVERLDPDHAVALEQSVVGEIAARERACMGKRRGSRRLGAADLERHDRDAALCRAQSSACGEGLWIARRLDEEADDLHLRPFDRIGDVVGDRCRGLAARGDREGEAQARIVMRQRSEDAARMCDEGDRAGRRLARARKAADPDPVEIVVEAHAVRAADRDARLLGGSGEPLGERRIAVPAAGPRRR